MNDLEKTIYELETSLLTPEVRSSERMLGELLADDFIEFGSSGLTYTKQNILERLPQSTSITTYNISDFTIKQISEGIVMANFKTARIKEGETSIALRTSLWRRHGDSWQMFFHQGTQIH